MRYAVIDVAGNLLPTVRRYLPSNYKAVQDGDRILIFGGDHHGWTLEDYVIPRLASGMIKARPLNPDRDVYAEIVRAHGFDPLA